MSRIELRADDALIKKLPFKTYQHVVHRQATQFSPKPNEPQQQQVKTPWGEQLLIKSGDYLVNELDSPEDKWPVAEDIFKKTYAEVEPGLVIKKESTELLPLVDIVADPNDTVAIYTLEGLVEVRAADFYLARGSQGEIWPFPKEKVEQTLHLVDDQPSADE